MKNKKLIIAGGSGFIGQALIKYFGKDNEIISLGRQSGDNHKNSYSQKLIHANDGYNVHYVKWDAKNTKAEWSKEVDGADLVLNLAGKSVNCRYHKKQKKEIIDSRVNATEAIGHAIRKAIIKPTLWINAASATIYQNSIDKPNDEFTGTVSERKNDNMPFNVIDTLRCMKNKFFARLLHGKNSVAYKETDLDFSVQVCKLWENSFFNQKTPGTRKVAMRTAITLGEGGVIIPYFNLCKFGLGGKQGNGKQMYTWVHIEDVARMIEWLFENKNAEGVYNCAAPGVVSNYSFMKTLREATGYHFGLPAYTWMLEAGAFIIGTETELILKSRWVVAARAMKEGFDFKYRFLKEALEDIVKTTGRNKYHLF